MLFIVIGLLPILYALFCPEAVKEASSVATLSSMTADKVIPVIQESSGFSSSESSIPYDYMKDLDSVDDEDSEIFYHDYDTTAEKHKVVDNTPDGPDWVGIFGACNSAAIAWAYFFERRRRARREEAQNRDYDI